MTQVLQVNNEEIILQRIKTVYFRSYLILDYSNCTTVKISSLKKALFFLQISWKSKQNMVWLLIYKRFCDLARYQSTDTKDMHFQSPDQWSTLNESINAALITFFIGQLL
jgi:hypothetical protein